VGENRQTIARALAPIFDAVRDVDADVSVAAISAIGEHAPQRGEQRSHATAHGRSGYYLPLVRLAATKAIQGAGALTPDAAGQLLEASRILRCAQLLEDAHARIPSPGLGLERPG
jgi:hypothetical protein